MGGWQIWARYLEGDNISTKIGSGQDRDRGGLPDFWTNREKSREIGINQGNRDKSREIGENQGQSRLFPTYLELFKRSG